MGKTVILGANGYIARNLLFVLKRDFPEEEILLCGCEPSHADEDNEHYIQVDLCDPEDTGRIRLDDADIIFMMVGRTGSANGFEEYESFIRTNEITLLNLLAEYRRQNSRAKIIFPSTRLVYKGKDGPQPESAEKEFKTIYAINKFACEQYLEQYHRVFGIRYCIFRICVPYGTLVPGASSYGTAEFMLKSVQNGQNISIYGDGTVRRTITYIEDVCLSLISGAFSDKCENDVFNVGGEDYSLKEMAELTAEKYNVGVDFVPWPEQSLKIESGDTVFDSTKLESITGFRCEKKFAEWIQ